MVIAILSDYSIEELINKSHNYKSETKLLLQHILNYSPVQLILNHKYVLTVNEYQKFASLYNQFLHGCPVAYLVGYKEFYSYNFKVTPDTLIPRPETELLVDEILRRCKPLDKVLDLGTGSGCIAISCKLEKPFLHITAVDQCERALATAKANAVSLSAAVEFIISNWFDNVSGKFNFIAANPPYIDPNDKHLVSLSFEPLMALTDGVDGISAIREIIRGASNFLQNKGYLLIEHGYDQGKQVREMFYAHDFKLVQTLLDYAAHERITLGQMIL